MGHADDRTALRIMGLYCALWLGSAAQEIDRRITVNAVLPRLLTSPRAA
jgi:hypothetical protein